MCLKMSMVGKFVVDHDVRIEDIVWHELRVTYLCAP